MLELKKEINETIGNKELTFRALTLNDELWLKENADLNSIFGEEIDLKGLTKILFHQLKDKSEFPRKVIKDFDEDGMEIETNIGGLYSFRELISGEKQKLQVVTVFTELLKLSRPEIKEDDNKESKGKK